MSERLTSAFAFGLAALIVLLIVVPRIVLLGSPAEPLWIASVAIPAVVLGWLAGPMLVRLSVEGKTLRQAFAGIVLSLLIALAGAAVFTVWTSVSASFSTAVDGLRSGVVPAYAIMLLIFALPFYFLATVALFWYRRWKAA